MKLTTWIKSYWSPNGEKIYNNERKNHYDEARTIMHMKLMTWMKHDNEIELDL